MCPSSGLIVIKFPKFSFFIPSVHFQFSYHSTAAIKHLAEPVNTHLVVWPCPSPASPPAALRPGICFPGETFQWRDPARWNQPGEGSPRTISLRDTVGFALQSLTLLYTLWVLMWHVDMCVCTFHRSFWIAVLLYGAVDGVRVGGVSAGLIWEMP